MDLTTLLETIREHGDIAYGFVFAYAAQNSLLAPLFAGYAAHLGAFDWATLVILCWAGGFIGDAIRFWIGRRWGMKLIKRFPKFERGIHVILRLVDRHHLWMILIHRYPHGIRGFAGFAFGMSNLSWGLFLVLNFVSAGIWSLVVVSAGYSFGHMSEKALGEAASGIGLGLLLAFLGTAWLLSKKLERVIERG